MSTFVMIPGPGQLKPRAKHCPNLTSIIRILIWAVVYGIEYIVDSIWYRVYSIWYTVEYA